MLHSHDIYEQRARALRHQELRAFARALGSFFLGAVPGHQARRPTPFAGRNPVNDCTAPHKQAA